MTTITPIRKAPDRPDVMTELDMRVDLAACYRLIAHFGMDDLVYSHITARVPSEDNQYLLNPYGLMYAEITASNLVKVDDDGNPVEPSEYPVNRPGFVVIHGAVHRARPDMHCVLHCHSHAATAVSALEEGLLPLTQGAMQFYDRVAYHDFHSMAFDDDDSARLVADLGDKQVMFMRNHGQLTVGRTVAEAFSFAYFLEEACRIQLEIMQSGGSMIQLSDAIASGVAEQYEKQVVPPEEREWPALLRMLDRMDPSYRE